MLSIDHLSLHFGARKLLDDISFSVGPRDRIGLVGANGTGKSTLLRIIASLEASDSGVVTKAGFVSVGYLPQEGITVSGRTVYDEVQTAFEDIVGVQQQLEELQLDLAHLDPHAAEYIETLEILGELQHKLEDLDAFRMKSKIERVLMGLGFSTEDFGRQTEEFSGGWQMRIALSKLLLKEPSLLLLDEPTNHLDLDSLEWLEEYLARYNGALILVSHDRALLDTLCSKVLVLRNGALETYAGNYSFYEREHAVRAELLVSRAKNQQQQLKQTQAFIHRFRYKATKARQVQSRVKQLERIELIQPEEEEEEIHFRFPQPVQSGRMVLSLRNISKQYGQQAIFSSLDYSVERGDKIVVVGVNGAGKSTLSRIIAGVEPVDSGERIEGQNVLLSYFAQHQAEELDLSKTALETVDEVAEGEIRKKLRTILGSFLFHGDDVFKKVAVLSGGEKSRLALAKMLLQPSNFLVMDEPTNHLDMRSKSVLQEALKNYEGSFVIVSHDKAFVDPLGNKVLEVSHKGIKTYLGTVTEYLTKKKEEEKGVVPAKAASAGLEIESGKTKRRGSEAERKKQAIKKLQPLKKNQEALEKEIERLELQKVELETLMADPDLYKDGEKARRVSEHYMSVQSMLTTAYFDWGKLLDKISAAQSLPGDPEAGQS
ncbi:MAG: ABC-F family ATP-binding cassette domain-containing protein [Bacteroidota bacterium]